MRQRIQSCTNHWLRACAAHLAVAGQCTQLACLHNSTLVVARPTAVTCHTHVPITQQPVRLSHQIKSEVFQTHSFIHYKGINSHVKGVTVQLSPCTTAATCLQLTAVQPRICREELATATQVALEAITPICSQHLTTLHMTAQQSMRYTHENSTITSSHTN